MAVKRRTIWFSDEDWAKLSEKAALHEVSPSVYIRTVTVGGGWLVPESLLSELRRVEREMIENPNPYREFRPAPKPGKRK